MKHFFIIFCFIFCGFPLLSSNFLGAKTYNIYAALIKPDTIIPKVFIKGEREKLENLLDQQYPQQLIRVFNNEAQPAFSAWANMLLEMEKFSESSGFDIKGIKAFATFYFDRYGNIRHIAYSLKGPSRYFKPEELDKFFRQFMTHYRMQVSPNNRTNFQFDFTLSLPYPRLWEKMLQDQKH